MHALPWQYAPALVGRTCMAAQGELRCMFSGAGAVPTAADSPCIVESQNCLLRWSFSAPSGVDSAEGKCSLGFSWIVYLEGRCRRRRTQRRAQLSLQLDVFCDEDFLQHA